ncbi:hypothetical protein H6504_04060 [Candidatus Woesearchaeota archaeon]|nr:hypothetical protein [Candidatus Woesearchaeota archaeon]
MPYDKSLDKELFGEEIEFETTKVKVSIMSYNDGQKKLQLSRENRDMNSGEFKFSKLGRMTKEEVEKILPIMQKAFGQME